MRITYPDSSDVDQSVNNDVDHIERHLFLYLISMNYKEDLRLVRHFFGVESAGERWVIYSGRFKRHKRMQVRGRLLYRGDQVVIPHCSLRNEVLMRIHNDSHPQVLEKLSKKLIDTSFGDLYLIWSIFAKGIWFTQKNKPKNRLRNFLSGL